MAKKSKTLPKKAIIMKDKEFAVVVRSVKGEVIDHDSFYFFRAKSGEFFRLPSHVSITPNIVGVECDAFVRDVTNECILNLLPNDVLEEKILNNDKYIPVDNLVEIDELLSERKADIFRGIGKNIINIMAFSILSAVSYFFMENGFVLEVVPPFMMACSLLLIAFTGFIPILFAVQKLTFNVLVDKNGNYIDVENGKTSLNGGMLLPRNKGDVGMVL